MRAFLDTNVLVDVFGRREPFYLPAARVWSRVESGSLTGYVSAISFNNVHYIVRRAGGRQLAHDAVKIMRGILQMVPLDEQILHRAMDSDFADFEDAIQFFSALRARADYLLTRNVRHFPAKTISALTPEEFLVAHPGA